MIESQYTQAIHKKLPKTVKKWKINDQFEAGVPDAMYGNLNTKSAKILFIEYKLIKTLPKRETTPIKPNLSEQQKIWLHNARKMGANVAVIIGCLEIRDNKGVKGVFTTSPDEWENGILPREFTARAESYQDLAEGITQFTYI